MTQEEKAKAYDRAIEELRGLLEGIHEEKCDIMEEDIIKIFLELKESEDERIRKWIIGVLSTYEHDRDLRNAAIAWLEKQGNNDIGISEATKQKLEDNLNKALEKETPESCNEFLEKQGEQEQLYIRFGEIPTDEKSKIYQGEIEVGTENGVSVYPAFKTNEGDIVLGLILPITKTTLYTQQHLLEYDNRPCYLVKGDYVGKDTDGQPLIKSVSTIEKIDSYRVKEEKQGEQKAADKVEPKFKVGDWIIFNGLTLYINEVAKGYYRTISKCGITNSYDWNIDNAARLWTIQEAKDGDVLSYKDEISLYKHDIKNCTKQETTFGGFVYHCCYDGKRFITDSLYSLTEQDKMDIQPATKEQRDLLFQKMKEAGYEWDAEKKELRKIEEDLTEFENALADVCRGWIGEELGWKDYIIKNSLPLLEFAKKQFDEYEQKPAWSEEDKQYFNFLEKLLENLQVKSTENEIKKGTNSNSEYYYKVIQWLKSLRPQNNITDEEFAQAKKDAYNNTLDKTEYHSGEPTFDDGWSSAIWYLKKRNTMPQSQWKPSEEQMKGLRWVFEFCNTSHQTNVLKELYEQLKQL